MVESTGTEFFVSYSRPDLDWARWVVRTLRDASHTVTFQDGDFRPGENFVLNIDDSVNKCERMLIVMSKSYLASEYCQRERTSFDRRDPSGRKGLLIPLIVEKGVEVDGTMGTITHIDLVKKDEFTCKALLLNGIKRKGTVVENAPFPGSAPKSPPPPSPPVAFPLGGTNSPRRTGDDGYSVLPSIRPPSIKVPFPGVSKPQDLLQTFFTIVLKEAADNIDVATITRLLVSIKDKVGATPISLVGVTVDSESDQQSARSFRLHLKGNDETLKTVLDQLKTGAFSTLDRFQTSSVTDLRSGIVDEPPTIVQRILKPAEPSVVQHEVKAEVAYKRKVGFNLGKLFNQITEEITDLISNKNVNMH